MAESTPALSAAIQSLLKSAVTGSNGQLRIWLYTSFGVVRGTAGHPGEVGFVDEVARQKIASGEVIAIVDATVEHYSSHLPTASFGQLFVRLEDVMGFALDSDVRQS